MSVKELLHSGKISLRAHEVSEVDAELLLAFLLNTERMELHARTFEVTPEVKESFHELITARIQGSPLQYLTGEAPFRYLVFDVGPGVLIPRPETELLVAAGLAEIERIQLELNQSNGQPESKPVSVIDLGSGSGAIAISIAHEGRLRGLPVTVVAVEKDGLACTWLHRNIQKHNVDVRVVASDVVSALVDVKADIVIANPPYIPDGTILPTDVAAHEPEVALFGGKGNGLEIPKLFITAAKRLLKPGGLFILEHCEEQGSEIAAFMQDSFTEITFNSDLAGRPRWMSARNIMEMVE